MSLWSTVVFPAALLAVWIVLHLYAYLRLAAVVGVVEEVRTALKVLFPVLALLYPLGLALVALTPITTDSFLLWPGALYLGFFVMAVTLLLVLDILVTGPFEILKRLGRVGPGTREFMPCVVRMAVVLITLLSLALTTCGAFGAMGDPQITRIEKHMPGLPPGLDGFRVVQVSDIHAGYLVGPKTLDGIARQVGDLGADLVVLTGDLSDRPLGGDSQDIGRLASLPARHGVLAITGNREHETGAEATVDNLRLHGLTVLRQEHRIIADGVVVAGVDDMDFQGGLLGVPDAIRQALAGVPKDFPVILLAHRPVKWDVAAHAGVDLMLCGHTHGGQIFPVHIPMKRIHNGFLSGRHEIGGMTLYLNNGTGFSGPPIRLLADPEILLVTLRSSPETAKAQ